MRFIKASERLPKHDWSIHVKIDGIPFMGNFYNVEPGGAVWFYVSKGLESWSIPPEKFGGLEWLDESEQDEGWVPVGSERKNFMRQQAVAAKELLKGFTPEQRDGFSNATKTVEEFADYILELANPTTHHNIT